VQAAEYQAKSTICSRQIAPIVAALDTGDAERAAELLRSHADGLVRYLQEEVEVTGRSETTELDRFGGWKAKSFLEQMTWGGILRACPGDH